MPHRIQQGGLNGQCRSRTNPTPAFCYQSSNQSADLVAQDKQEREDLNRGSKTAYQDSHLEQVYTFTRCRGYLLPCH